MQLCRSFCFRSLNSRIGRQKLISISLPPSTCCSRRALRNRSLQYSDRIGGPARSEDAVPFLHTSCRVEATDKKLMRPAQSRQAARKGPPRLSPDNISGRFYQTMPIGAIQAASSAAPAERSHDMPPLRDRVVLRRAEDDNPIRGRDFRCRIGKISRRR